MEKVKSSYNNKFKISAPTWNVKFELAHILHQIFKIILKKHGENTDNPSVKIYTSKDICK